MDMTNISAGGIVRPDNLERVGYVDLLETHRGTIPSGRRSFPLRG